MHLLRRCASLLLLVLGTCAAVTAEAKSDGACFEAALADVRAMVESAPEEWGLSVTVTDRERTRMVVLHGYADIDRRIPVTEQTRFAIGSISKSFAAMVLMQMADEGRFDPAAPIARYLPEFHPKSAYAPITGQSLLTHSSGLPNYLANVASMRAVIAALNDVEPAYAPGAHFWYSNSGYQLLGYAAERIDGVPYPLIVRRRMLDRLGMTASAPQIDAGQRGTMAKSYQRAPDGTLQDATWFPYLAADGGLVSTAGHMARYARMLLARGALPTGRLISERAFDRIAQPAVDDYGYGFDVFDGGGVLAHSGTIAGYKAYLNADIAHGFAVILLANGPLDNTLRDRIVARLTEAAGGHPRAISPAPLAFADAASFAGRFADAEGKALTFETGEGGGLTLPEPGGMLPLVRLGRNTWGAYVTAQGPRCFQFFRNAAGAVIDVSVGASSYVKNDPAAATPGEWQPYTGRYMAHGAEGPGLRVLVRGGELMMAYTDSNAAPEALLADGPGRFRLVDPEWAPERLVFDTVIDGKTQRLMMSGVPLYRIDLP